MAEAELHKGVFMVRNVIDEEIDHDFIEKLFKRYCSDVTWHNIDESKVYLVVPKENHDEIRAIRGSLVRRTFQNHEIWCCKTYYKECGEIGRPNSWEY